MKNIYSCLPSKLKEQFEIFLFDDLPSTNTFLKNNLNVSKKGKSIAIARTQSKGRGRNGNSFYSPENGLYFSIRFKLIDNELNPQMITVIAAVAAVEAIKKTTNIQCGIKWVNDIFFKDKKIAGILTESVVTSNELSDIILGFGINIYLPKTKFPKELEHQIGTLFDTKPDYTVFADLVAEITNIFFDYYINHKEKNYIDLYKSYSILINKKVIFTQNGETHLGTAVSIDDDANLIVENNKGHFVLNSGSISIF